MHRPVMVAEVVDLLVTDPDGTYIDCTVGSGGHAAAIFGRLSSRGRLIGIDRDAEAIARAAQALEPWRGRWELLHGAFAETLAAAAAKAGGAARGCVFDLGVSSNQIDDARRGFSFAKDGPLDMRMDAGAPVSAETLVNELPEGELAAILQEFGEERCARRIARQLVSERGRERIRTTGRLAEIVSGVLGRRGGGIHPATRTFQALRIAVNGELEQAAAGLEQALNLVAEGGRVAVISFHSLEDRIAKRTFAEHAGRWESLAAGGSEWRGRLPAVRLVTRKPVRPTDAEVAENPRSRSAKLRVAERLAAPAA